MRSCDRAIVVTTINSPTTAILELARRTPEWPLLVVGDLKTPADWSAEGVEYLSAEDQRSSPHALQPLLPFNHYCRKNIGYLEAISAGARVIAETDDDNHPREWPPGEPAALLRAEVVSRPGWVNVYPYFTDAHIWPRGLPLEEVRREPPSPSEAREVRALIHQYLAEGDPDVDAVYRLVVGRADHKFADRTIVLEPGTATPFNSQCTIWFEGALPYLYLPSFVSFRMTDIWRSYVAQACIWAAGERVAYLGKGVHQDRNAHDLHRDLVDELIGYERNDEMMRRLAELPLSADPAQASENLRLCYRLLHEMEIVPERELPLVDAWCADIERLTAPRRGA